MSFKFSIITPAYNRASYLRNIYDSLLAQNELDMEWIIIDDGSHDNTSEIVSGFPKIFEIKYCYQENKGKPRAVNSGVALADSLISVILDSDDIILPRVLNEIWDYYDSENKCFYGNCVSVSGLCIDHSGKIVGDKFTKDRSISNHIKCRFNMDISGDKCEFFLTRILKNYPYPILKGEKFITETLIWNRISLCHNTLYVNRIFKKVIYLLDGLSAQDLFAKHPLGWQLFYNEASISKFKLKWQLIHSFRYIKFAKKNKQKYLFRNSMNKFIFPLGLCLYYSKKIIRAMRNKK
jgi:glycosyltransferase involved in cell wall biosynthesis